MLQALRRRLAAALVGTPEDPRMGYHRWFYNTQVWTRMTWAGVQVMKLPSDLWNYQEIIVERRPSLIVEYGRWTGGATLFFASLLESNGLRGSIFSVDIEESRLDPRVRDVPSIELMTLSSTDPAVTARVRALREEASGSAFVILDSDHSKEHVLNELLSLRDVLRPGDYVIVEDGNINGHPINNAFGPGPYEAVQEYFARFPDDYTHDYAREHKFGLTFAPEGYLIRR